MGRHNEGSLCAVQSHPAPALPCPPQVPASLEDDQVVSWKTGVRLTQATAAALDRLVLLPTAACCLPLPLLLLQRQLRHLGCPPSGAADEAASSTNLPLCPPERKKKLRGQLGIKPPASHRSCLPTQVLLSDILPTAWHSCELGEVGPGDRVAIWGAGPGELCCQWCVICWVAGWWARRPPGRLGRGAGCAGWGQACM